MGTGSGRLAAVVLLVCPILLLGACTRLTADIAPPGVSGEALPPEVSGEEAAVYPAPVPVPAKAVEGEPPGRPEFIQRLRRAGPAATVVLARVERFSVEERLIPTSVWPEPHESVIATKAMLAIDETLCGPALGARGQVTYVGGRIGRVWLRTSLMPQDLAPGQAYLLTLSKAEDEHFLIGGKYELLHPDPDEIGAYTDYADRRVSESEILGACP